MAVSCDVDSHDPLKNSKNFQLLSHLCSELHFFETESQVVKAVHELLVLLPLPMIGKAYHLAANCLKFCLVFIKILSDGHSQLES